MKHKTLWVIICKTLAAITAMLTLIMLWAPGLEAATKYRELYRFSGSDGANPLGSLIFDAAGNLYGTTSFGGNLAVCGGLGCGLVFRLTPNADGRWKESVLYNFNGGADGRAPVSALVFDQAGNLYGTTLFGGTNDVGSAFMLSPNADGSWTENVLHSFTGTDGRQPAEIIFDSAGNLYGTTEVGGVYGKGTVYRLAPQVDGTWTESVLYSFTGRADGVGPVGGVVLDSAGNLYGTIRFGSASKKGTVFKLTPNLDGTWTESVLHGFSGPPDGSNPVAAPIFDASGNLYGTTSKGGKANRGIVYELTPNADGTWTEKQLHAFANHPGSEPYAGLIFDPTGNLYGATTDGGPANGGVVFKLTPKTDGTWVQNVLHVFQGKPAVTPFGDLVRDKGGNLYGTTQSCATGRPCRGVVFEVSP